jgi:hypothetical protein
MAIARTDGADFGYGDLVVGQHLEQKCLEGFVGAVDLVDQQHAGAILADGLEQRALKQEVTTEDIGFAHAVRLTLMQTYGHELTPVVPLVGGLRHVQTLEALQPHQLGAKRFGQRGGQRRLAHARVAFEQQRALQFACEPHRGGQIVVRKVTHPLQRFAQHAVGGSRVGLLHAQLRLPNRPAHQFLIRAQTMAKPLISRATGGAAAGEASAVAAAS